jgi:hypothetical protein
MANRQLTPGGVYKFVSTDNGDFFYIAGTDVPFEYDFLNGIFITGSIANPTFIEFKGDEGTIYRIQELANEGGLGFLNGNIPSRYHFVISGSNLNNERYTNYNSYIGLDSQTVDPSTTSGFGHVYAKSGEVYVQDDSGNVTQISPHNEEGDWEYFSRNKITGKTIRINMEHFVKRMEEITGEVFIKYE